MAWKIFGRKKQKSQEPPLYGNVDFNPEHPAGTPWQKKNQWLKSPMIWTPVAILLLISLLLTFDKKGMLNGTKVITGTVVDKNSVPVAQVPVRFLNQVTFTDASGTFRFEYPPRDSIAQLLVAGEGEFSAITQNIFMNDDHDLRIVLPEESDLLADVPDASKEKAAPETKSSKPLPAPTTRFVFADGNYRIDTDLSWEELEARRKTMAAEEFHLGSIALSSRPGEPAAFTAVWYPGGKRQRLDRAESWVKFVENWREYQQRDLVLVSLESFVENNHRVFAGVWQSGTTVQKIWLEQSWAQFAERHNRYEQEGYHLVDLETYLDRSARKFVGVWEPALGMGQLRRTTGKSEFLRSIREAADEGLHLVDLEIFVEAGQTRYIGAWSGGGGQTEFVVESLEKEFQRKHAAAESAKLRLIDLEYSFPDQQKRVSAVWYGGDAAIAVDADL